MRGAAGTRWYETLQRYVCIEFVCVLVCTLLTAGLSCTDGIFPDFPSYPDLDTMTLSLSSLMPLHLTSSL